MVGFSDRQSDPTGRRASESCPRSDRRGRRIRVGNGRCRRPPCCVRGRDSVVSPGPHPDRPTSGGPSRVAGAWLDRCRAAPIRASDDRLSTSRGLSMSLALLASAVPLSGQAEELRRPKGRRSRLLQTSMPRTSAARAPRLWPGSGSEVAAGKPAISGASFAGTRPDMRFRSCAALGFSVAVATRREVPGLVPDQHAQWLSSVGGHRSRGLPLSMQTRWLSEDEIRIPNRIPNCRKLRPRERPCRHGIHTCRLDAARLAQNS